MEGCEALTYSSAEGEYECFNVIGLMDALDGSDKVLLG